MQEVAGPRHHLDAHTAREVRLQALHEVGADAAVVGAVEVERGHLERHAHGLEDAVELGRVVEDGPHGVAVVLASYFDDRIRRRRMRAVPDVGAAARQVIETCVFWAVHRHWDARPQRVDDAAARATAVHFVVHALAKE